jgi:hypothetical protein
MLLHPEIWTVKPFDSVDKFQEAKEKQIYIGEGGVAPFSTTSQEGITG